MNPISDFKPILFLVLTIISISVLLVIILKSLFPLVLAIFIAALIDPAVNYVVRKTGLDRGFVVAATLTGIFSGLGYLLIVLLARLTFELKKLINTLPIYKYYYSKTIESISLRMMEIFEYIPEDAWSFINDNFEQYMSSMISSLSSYYGLIMNKISALPNFLAGILVFIIFTFLFSYFISKDKYRIVYNIKNLFPEAIQEKVQSFQIELLFSFMRLIKAQMVLVMISTLITITGFYIIKVEYALSLGIICGLLDMLPLVGPSLIFIPWIVFTSVMGNMNFAMKILILFITILGTRQVLQAKIIGQNLGIDPLLSLVSIYLGVEIFGFLGLIIGPLVVVIVRSLIHSGLIPPLNRPKDKL